MRSALRHHFEQPPLVWGRPGLQERNRVLAFGRTLESMDDENAEDVAEHDAFLSHNLKGLMMDIVAAWNAGRDAELQKGPFRSIRPADLRMFANLRGRPKPISQLHRRLGISRQAAHKSIMRLVDHGVVAIEPLPNSRRDKLLVITPLGEELRSTVAGVFQKNEAECREVLGDESTEQLRASLIALQAHLRRTD